MSRPKYTPANPYVLIADKSEWGPRITDWISARGGVAVWYAAALEMAGETCLTPALTDAQDGGDATNHPCPGWQWEKTPQAIITDPACIRVEAPRPTPLTTRLYMDLELFAIAARRIDATVKILTRVVWPNDLSEMVAEPKVEEFLDYLDSLSPELAATPQALILQHERQAHDPYGTLLGYETYEAQLAVAPFETGDTFNGPGVPSGLARWQVRVDSMLASALIGAPEEPVVECGWFCRGTDDFIRDEDFDHTTDADHGDSPWVEACRIDGEVLEISHDEVSVYSRPDPDFVWQELDNLLVRLLAQGIHRTFDPDASRLAGHHVWCIRDSVGGPIDVY